MKTLFQDIRAGQLDAVASRLDADPGLIAATAKAPPKKDDDQSTLQVAIKSGAAVFSTRFGRNRALPSSPPQIEVMNSARDFERAFGVLSEVVSHGADPNWVDHRTGKSLVQAVDGSLIERFVRSE